MNKKTIISIIEAIESLADFEERRVIARQMGVKPSMQVPVDAISEAFKLHDLMANPRDFGARGKRSEAVYRTIYILETQKKRTHFRFSELYARKQGRTDNFILTKDGYKLSVEDKAGAGDWLRVPSSITTIEEAINYYINNPPTDFVRFTIDDENALFVSWSTFFALLASYDGVGLTWWKKTPKYGVNGKNIFQFQTFSSSKKKMEYLKTLCRLFKE